MKLTASFALAVLATALVGCQVARMSPREAFLSRTPDRTNYFRCYEVSLESLRGEEDRIVRLTKNFSKGVREASADCPACPALQERLSRIEMIADKLHQEHVEFMRKLEQVYNPKTDVILFYHYWAGDLQKAGYLVTRDGTPRRTFEFGEDNTIARPSHAE